MESEDPPLEGTRFRKSQTPESPRPVHLPKPSNIPVLQNQMDPVFNDTATYNIPSNQTFSPYSDNAADSARAYNEASYEENDAVQNFLLGAEAENMRFEHTLESSMPVEAPISNSNHSQVVDQPSVFPSLAHDYQNAEQSHSDVPSTIPQPSIPVENDATLEPTAELSNGSMPEDATLIQEESGPDPDKKVNDITTDAATTSALPLSTEPVNKNDNEGVDYQSLLDTITQSTSTAPAVESIAAPTTTAYGTGEIMNPLPSVPGLPPKPPAQDYLGTSFPLDSHPGSSSHNFPVGQGALSEESNTQRTSNEVMGTGVTQPLWKSQPTESSETSTGNQLQGIFNPVSDADLHKRAGSVAYTVQSNQQDSAGELDQPERPWSPETQQVYDHFLEDERRYVTEGIWDRFPAGSRLFVGNLPSEKVTKRDLFHVFHRHGRLAQISIKQAYGFVQYHDSASCANALASEQGIEIRGRKVHLEVSKPQKNTRNAGQSGTKVGRRRSRSPDRGVSRTTSRSNQGGRPPYSDYRDEPTRRRDEYRQARSPSPRGYVRQDYRSDFRSPQQYSRTDGRQESPFYDNVNPNPDDDASLPLPRRIPRDVPDIQILILEPDVAQSFINWVEGGFRNKGLRAATIWMSPRLSMAAVVRRQIIEGVQAVVKLTKDAQWRSKMPLQVFDRSAGASNVNFNEYADLDVQVAADIVLHARQKERNQAPQVSPIYPPQPPFIQPNLPPAYAPSYGHPMPQQYPQAPPPIGYPYQAPQQQAYRQQPPTPSSANTNPPNLQELLANLRGPNAQGHPQASQQQHMGRPTDLAGLLSNVAARSQNNVQQAYGQPPPSAYSSYQNSPTTPNYATGHSNPQQNVQNIMDQLARYNR